MRFVYALLFIALPIENAFGQHADFSTISFKIADSVAMSHKGKSLKNLPVLTHELTANLKTDVEKIRAIYTWVCTNIENDYYSYLKTSKKRKKFKENRTAYLDWNNSFTPQVFKKLVNEKKTACTGYAYLIKEMVNLAGFKSKIINGYGRTPTLLLNTKSTPNHSWNAVKINNKWYLCDATWSAGKILLDDAGPRFEANYDDIYFLADPNLFIKNHFPLEQKLSLLDETPTLNEFMDGPVVYKEAFSQKVTPHLPKKMHLEIAKNERVAFVLKVPRNFTYETINLSLNNGSRDVQVEPSIKILDGNRVRLEYKYEGTGLYDTHIKIGGAIVTTYVVRVRRK
jgi:hypothetical protein